MKCKNCNQNDAVKYSKYTNGEFCSSLCARGFSTKNKREQINNKVSLKLKGRTTAKKINKICPECNSDFYVFKKNNKQTYCSMICSKKSSAYRNKVSKNQLKRCEDINERIRLKNIGRKGGFGTKGYTSSGIFYQSMLEKKAFELLEFLKIEFVPHKNIPNSSKVSDIFIVNYNIWIELDEIDREKRKKWLKKDYDYWIEKIQIYKDNNLNYIIIKSLNEFEMFLKEKKIR